MMRPNRKNQKNFLLIILLGFVPIVPVQSTPAPPPIKPFENIEKPTEQTSDVHDLLSYLPETLATFGENSRITKSELIDEMGMGLTIATQQGRNFSREEIHKIIVQLTDSMINLRFMTSSATADGFKPNLDAASKEIAMMRGKYGEEGFKSLLTMQGLSQEQLEKRLAKKMMIDHWIEDHISPQKPISLDEINEYYSKNTQKFRHPDQIRISHIFLRSDPSMSPETREQIKRKLLSLHDRIIAGEDFAELAKLHGMNPDAQYGGDLGFVSLGYRIEDLEFTLPKTLFKLEVGKLSDVISSGKGFHLFQVTDRRSAETMSLDEDLIEKIKEKLKQEKISNYLNSQYEVWKNSNNITYFFEKTHSTNKPSSSL